MTALARCLAAVRHFFARKERFPFPRMLGGEVVAATLEGWLENFQPGIYKVGREVDAERICIWTAENNGGIPRKQAAFLCPADRMLVLILSPGDMLCMDDEGMLSVERERVGL